MTGPPPRRLPEPLPTPLPGPLPTPLTARYWSYAAEGVLALQRCLSCARVVHHPRAYCPHCTSGELEWFAASGRASLYSYVIVHRGEGGFVDRVPYAVAVVELAEGPRLVSNIVGVPQTPEALVLDMPLRVRFERRGEFCLPVFAPDPADAADAVGPADPTDPAEVTDPVEVTGAERGREGGGG